MDAIFLKILNMSIAASWLILIVIVLRHFLKKAPKWISCVLWALAALRLICPFSFESALSLMPSAETIPAELFVMAPPENSQAAELNVEVNPLLPGDYSPELNTSVDRLQVKHIYATLIWVCGAALMLLYAAFSYLRLRKNLREAIPLRDNILLCDAVRSPFILGVIRPKIFLPSGIDSASINHVIAHEKAHLKRRDQLWKPLGFLLLAVYWFNPLCWVAYSLLCRDIELACDEKVISEMDISEKKAYTSALLSCSLQRRMITVCPLAFGEVGVKDRVKNVLSFKKPAFRIIIAAVTVCIVVAVCFLTNPIKAPLPLNNIQIIAANTLDMRSAEPALYRLNEAEMGELNDRLSNLNVGKKDRDLAGFTPLYSLTVTAKDVEQFALIGFDSDGNHIAMQYRNEFYRISDSDFSSYLRYICAGGSRAEAAGSITLSLDDVVTLSQKGEALTWSDFDGFSYSDIGSGLYIRAYEIDPLFTLLIGGGGLKQPPFYIYLTVNNAAQDRIDIRTEDPAAFIEAHKADTPAASVSRVGGAAGPKNPSPTPPALQVSQAGTGGAVLEALLGTYSFGVDNGDGTGVITEADSLHPLSCRDFMPTLTLQAASISSRDKSEVVLSFGLTPDTVSVRRWDESCWEDPSKPAMTVDVQNLDGAFVFTAEETACIYEVTARWNGLQQYEGTAHYSFFVEPFDAADSTFKETS